MIIPFKLTPERIHEVHRKMQTIHCSFCGKEKVEGEGEPFISSGDAHICKDCLKHAASLVQAVNDIQWSEDEPNETPRVQEHDKVIPQG